MMNNSMSQLTRYETAIRDARRMRAEALRQGTASMFGAVRRVFSAK